MIQLIVGKEGKGKTKHLLEKVNAEIKTASGNIAFLDRGNKHMFELNNKVRLINVNDYNFENSSELVGFIYGLLSQDHDLQQVYIDGMFKILGIDKDEFTALIEKLNTITEKFNFDLIVSASIDESELDDSICKYVIVSL
ncbi:MAG: twitching motility protein PilT [Lachnospiraceae bacterium]|nr:twitching motility protein PilT [Lachnospiraceae bacterium]